MSQRPKAQEDRRFIETCLELDLLHDTDADSLFDSVGDETTTIAQSALQRGLLTPADVDIVLSLQNPTSVAPGYKVLELIGRGGMGVVYRAEQIDLERTVALKTILISNVDDPTVAARFEREAKALARLQHPNIVQALNFGKHEGRYYFAMEYVPGRSCEQAVDSQGPLPAPQVWSIIRQAASGLLHASRQNLIHRDIKPGNLILLPPPEGSPSQAEIVKITDFGLAMFADPGAEHLKLTSLDKVIGSPVYMSLEQFEGRDVDFRSDLYSLGATAWHLLFGSPPFTGTTVGALYRQKSQPIAVDPATLPVALPVNQLQLLLGMLDPNPDRRPQGYQQLIDAIDGLGVCDTPAAIQVDPAAPYDTPAGVSISEHPTWDTPVPPEPTLQPAASASDPAGDELTQTIELTDSAVVPKVKLRKWQIVTAIVALVCVAIGVAKLLTPSRGERTHTRVVGTTPLFDGESLSGWDVGGSMVGAWNTVEAPDASTAIACTTDQGALTRRYPNTDNPRINLFVWIQPESGPVDIDFALESQASSDIRGSLRMTGTANQLGTKTEDFGELKVIAESPALPTVHDRYHVIHLERQPSDWYVFLEEDLIGTLPIKKVGEGNQIRLVVHAGQGDSNAYFADIQLNDLK